MITKTTEYLKYEFTRAEINEHALNLARKNQELAELDLRQKHLQADINAGKKAANETIAQLAGWISHGHDYRMISCVIKFNDPVDGKKTIYRENSYEWVKTVDMDASEIAETKQADLPFDGTPCDACSGQGVQPISGHPTCLVCGGSGKQLGRDHSDEIRIRVLRDRAEKAEAELAKYKQTVGERQVKTDTELSELIVERDALRKALEPFARLGRKVLSTTVEGVGGYITATDSVSIAVEQPRVGFVIGYITIAELRQAANSATRRWIGGAE